MRAEAKKDRYYWKPSTWAETSSEKREAAKIAQAMAKAARDALLEEPLNPACVLDRREKQEVRDRVYCGLRPMRGRYIV